MPLNLEVIRLGIGWAVVAWEVTFDPNTTQVQLNDYFARLQDDLFAAGFGPDTSVMGNIKFKDGARGLLIERGNVQTESIPLMREAIENWYASLRA